MTRKTEITQEEIAKALKNFRQRGGLVRQLPDEIRIPSTTIGERYGVFEIVGVGYSGSDN